MAESIADVSCVGTGLLDYKNWLDKRHFFDESCIALIDKLGFIFKIPISCTLPI